MFVTMKKDRMCKHSVVYKPADEKALKVFASVYLMNAAYQELNMPDKIVMEIDAYEETKDDSWKSKTKSW